MATLAVEKPNLKLSKANAVHWLMLAVLWSPLSPCIAQTYPWYPFPISKIAVQADGKVLISGGFDRIDGVPRTNLARLNLDGTLDRSFVPAAEVSSNFTQG